MKIIESNIFYSNGTGMENNKFNRNTLKQQVKCITKQYLEICLDKRILTYIKKLSPQ